MKITLLVGLLPVARALLDLSQGWRVFLCGTALLLYSLAATALDPDRAFRNYVIDRWSIENGLPQLSVLSITQDATGYLWLTTQNGVARFDGVRFRVFNVENTPALRANIIDTVQLAADGSLWFGSTRGLTRYQDGVWTAVDLAAGGDVAVSNLLNDVNGALLVGSDQGLFRVDVQGPRRIGLDGISITALARIGSAIYAGTHDAVFEIKASRERRLELPGGDDAPAVNVLVATPNGLLAGTGRGLYRWVNEQWEQPSWALPLNQHRIESIYPDNDGNLWIGTTEGLYRHHSKRGLERCLSDILPKTAWIGAFFEDREGNLWVGSLTHSLIRLWNGWVSRVSVSDGLSDPFVWSVVGSDDERLWIGTNTGVEELRADGSIHLLTSTRTLPESSVYNLFRSRNGDLLIGTRAGMARWNGKALTRDSIWEPLASAGIRAVVEEDLGHLWIATNQGLYEQIDDQLRLHGKSEGLQETRIRALAQTPGGELWVGTERGLYRGFEGQFRRIDQPETLAPALVTAVLPWRGARMVVATMDAGLFVGAPGNFRQITTVSGLPYNSAFALATDSGWLYVSSPEGVYRIATSELDRFHLEGGSLTADMVVQTGTQHAGALRSRCCNGGAQARIAHSKGSFWLPTLDGVLRLDTERIRRSALSPPAVAESIEHLGVIYDGAGPHQLDGSNGDVAIQFAGLALQDPTGLRFRYRLLGYDERWRSARERRVVYYTNLAPGQYRFEAIATSSAGLDSPKAATLNFYLVPPFYRAPWFMALMVIVAVGLILLTWIGYRKRLQSREHGLEQQIRQRTADLNRANERLRSANRALVEESHTDTLTGLRNRRFLAHFMTDWRRSGENAKAHRLAFVLIDLDHFKRVNDAHGHLAGDEVLRQVAAVLIDIAGADGIPLRWGGEEFLLVMPAESVADAAQLCEHLRASIAHQGFIHSGSKISRLTASIGYALFPALADKSDAEDWNLSLELADAGLYSIKTSGRNGWAIVHARAHARAADFGAGFSGRLRELANSGLVTIENNAKPKAQNLDGAH